MTTLKQLILNTWPDLAATGNYPEIARLGNTPAEEPNPQPQQQTPKRVTMLEVFNAIAVAAPADLAKAGQVPDWMIERAERAMEENDRLGMGNWLVSIGAAAGLSAAAKTALGALLAETEPDPHWMPTISGPSPFGAAGFAHVDAAAVQEALHAAAE